MQRAVRPRLIGRASGVFVTAFYVPAAFAGYLFSALVAGTSWGGAATWQLTVLPLIGSPGVSSHPASLRRRPARFANSAGPGPRPESAPWRGTVTPFFDGTFTSFGPRPRAGTSNAGSSTPCCAPTASSGTSHGWPTRCGPMGVDATADFRVGGSRISQVRRHRAGLHRAGERRERLAAGRREPAVTSRPASTTSTPPCSTSRRSGRSGATAPRSGSARRPQERAATRRTAGWRTTMSSGWRSRSGTPSSRPGSTCPAVTPAVRCRSSSPAAGWTRRRS